MSKNEAKVEMPEVKEKEEDKTVKLIKMVCITKYDSTVLKRRVDVGEILTKVPEERAQVLIKAGVAEKA